MLCTTRLPLPLHRKEPQVPLRYHVMQFFDQGEHAAPTFVANIESNTKRYLALFAHAASAALPRPNKCVVSRLSHWALSTLTFQSPWQQLHLSRSLSWLAPTANLTMCALQR